MKKISFTTIFDGVMQLVTQKKIFLCASHLVENSTPPPPPAELNLSASTKTILSSLVINDDALNLLNPQDPPYITLPVELHLQSASTKTILSSLEIEDEPLNLLDPQNPATILHLMSSTSLRWAAGPIMRTRKRRTTAVNKIDDTYSLVLLHQSTGIPIADAIKATGLRWEYLTSNNFVYCRILSTSPLISCTRWRGAMGIFWLDRPVWFYFCNSCDQNNDFFGSPKTWSIWLPSTYLFHSWNQQNVMLVSVNSIMN